MKVRLRHALTCVEIQQCRQDFAQRKTKHRDFLYKLWDKGANTIRLSTDEMRYLIDIVEHLVLNKP